MELREDAQFSLDIPSTWNSFIFVFGGDEIIYNHETRVPLEHVCKLKRHLTTHHFSGKNGRFVLVAGQPINEPIVKYGPIVMNT